MILSRCLWFPWKRPLDEAVTFHLTTISSKILCDDIVGRKSFLQNRKSIFCFAMMFWHTLMWLLVPAGNCSGTLCFHETRHFDTYPKSLLSPSMKISLPHHWHSEEGIETPLKYFNLRSSNAWKMFLCMECKNKNKNKNDKAYNFIYILPYR